MDRSKSVMLDREGMDEVLRLRESLGLRQLWSIRFMDISLLLGALLRDA